MSDKAVGIFNHVADELLIFCRLCASPSCHMAVSMPSTWWMAPAF